MYIKFALRDSAVVLFALLVWWLLADLSAKPGPVGDFTGIIAGGLFGVIAYILHEWGHLLAGLASGNTMTPASSLRSLSVFKYGAKGNSLGQFLIMSSGGFVATGAVIAAYYLWLPDDLLATHVARGAALFLAFLGVTLELPLVALAIMRRAAPAELDRAMPKAG